MDIETVVSAILHDLIEDTDVTFKAEELSLSQDHKKLYNLIWSRFVASQMPQPEIIVNSIKAKKETNMFETSVSSISFDGFYKVMPPGKKLLRFWKRVNVTVGNPITFEDWIMNENGGDMDNEKITQIQTLDEERRDQIFRKLYRNFTNQLMETIRLMGAP